MLYVTTRSKTDSYTAHRVLFENRAPDGGHFLPFRMPQYTVSQINEILDCPFGDIVAQILNGFFSSNLTGWDIDCCIGKGGVKVSSMSRRVLLAELWHNPGIEFAYMEDLLFKKLCPDAVDEKVSQWADIAIRIAVLFAVFSQLKKQGYEKCDVAVNSGDFSVPMAVWYARKMGLPVGTIVCTCNENSAPWDFLHRGELNTGVLVQPTTLRELDVANPDGLERLIFATLGHEETQKYIACCERRGNYQIRPDMVKQLNDGMFVSVVGKDRVASLISSIFRSNAYILDPYTAISYGGLQDYRAKTGESCPTVLLWERSPLQFINEICNATGLSNAKIESILA